MTGVPTKMQNRRHHYLRLEGGGQRQVKKGSVKLVAERKITPYSVDSQMVGFSLLALVFLQKMQNR